MGCSATGVFGDQHGNLVFTHEFKLGLQIKRPACTDHAGLWRKVSRVGRFNGTEQIVVLGSCQKRPGFLASGRQEHGLGFGIPSAGPGKCAGGFGNIGHHKPRVLRGGGPARSFQPQERPLCGGAGHGGMLAHLRGKWVGRIYNGIYGMIMQPVGQPRYAAKAPDASAHIGRCGWLVAPARESTAWQVGHVVPSMRHRLLASVVPPSTSTRRLGGMVFPVLVQGVGGAGSMQKPWRRMIAVDLYRFPTSVGKHGQFWCAVCWKG